MRDIHLKLDRLAVGYNGKALIKGIEIGVHRGEIVTLVGPNGSGKSTILKSITRQLELISGQVFLNEKDLKQYSQKELAEQMAIVLTGRIQSQLMTCRDLAAMGRYPYTGRLGILTEQDERKVDEALSLVHAEHLADRPFDAVSDGERQRILLARAICQEPEIIVLDEPTSFLDIRHKLELLSILYKMAKEQKITVVMSLHEIDLAMKISDRVICVRGEEIFACGAPEEMLDDDTIRELYDLDPALGRFDARSGSLELNFAQSKGQLKTANMPAVLNASSADGTENLPRAAYSNVAAEADGYEVPRFMIAAPGSGNGKTLVTCGLLRLLQRHGQKPDAFKCGPDYIDPMFHRQVLGIPSRNLDTFFSPDGAVNDILRNAVKACGANIAVIEGVMGFYDGTGVTGMEASSYDLAVQTNTPVILVVNAKGMGRSVVPLIKGLSEYSLPKNSRIRGVILNGVSKGMVPLMKGWIEEETDLKVVGSLPMDRSLSWESRHLGLLQPGEIGDLQNQIDHLADVLEETIDMELLLEIAGGAAQDPMGAMTLLAELNPAGTKIRSAEPDQTETKTPSAETVQRGTEAPQTVCPRIAVALDEAFNFYYEDNLELLQECGAQLVFFSPVHDEVLPDADGLLLGGGYPELYAEALGANAAMKEQIRAQSEAGMPILAECGGFMYLQEYLEFSGTRYKMCGVLPGISRKTDHLVRFGYVELEAREGEPADSPASSAGFSNLSAGYLSQGHRIRGHEFHYFDSTDNGAACVARKPGKNRSWDCMVVRGNIMAGFPHLYYRSDPGFAASFVDRCRLFARER